IVINLQKSYLEAGADIIYAPTFGANGIKLKEYGLDNKVDFINKEIIKITKKAVELYKTTNNKKVFIAGNLTMTGEQLYPVGKLKFEDLVEIYKEQVNAIIKEGVDLFVIETMMSLQESRAAVLAIKESCNLPIMVTLTYEANGRTLYGTDPVTALLVLQSMGVDAVGLNCSTGPDKMIVMVKSLKEYANVPLIVKPNAGMPALINDKTVFPMAPKEFAEQVKILIENGVSIVGGCCGTTAEHIKALSDLNNNMAKPNLLSNKTRILTTERNYIEINLDGKFIIIGERINPTGKKNLQEELRNDSFNIVGNMAIEQEEMGANILDINVGMNGIDEKQTMINAMEMALSKSNLPLAIDSSHIEVIEVALRLYPGRALINSISLEKDRADILLPMAKKYGAMFILLPLTHKGLPKDFDEKKSIIKTLVNKAFEYGLSKEDIIVDGLVNTVAANKNAAADTIETIRYCKDELGIATVVGLSNISFGLPNREFINSTFLSMAISAGLTMAIANPAQALLTNTILAADVLMNREDADIRYIENVVSVNTSTDNNKTKDNVNDKRRGRDINPIFTAVLKADNKNIIDLVNAELKSNNSASNIIDNILIPAINEVGDLFDKQKYFLPQLIGSAETMKKAIDYLEPMLEIKKSDEKTATIVIATVAGDIHDIGKNLVVLMLKNYGYNVIDLGKDVSSEKIIKVAQKVDADIIALSALMTTTMIEMKNVVKLAKEYKLKAMIIIGGAVITKGYAKEIGADGYSADAQSAVKLVQRIYKPERTKL
ncbi:MAG TPA: dihydropteroate synthase, partial [Clostridiales bacterium]|nr:dihydropteroate synthase [Clostridiales bacterium]